MLNAVVVAGNVIVEIDYGRDSTFVGPSAVVAPHSMTDAKNGEPER